MEIIDSTFEGHFEVQRTRVFVLRLRRVETRRFSRFGFCSEPEVFRDRGIVPERELATAAIFLGVHFPTCRGVRFRSVMGMLPPAAGNLRAAFRVVAPTD
jgi:hypothetical protein